MTTTKPSHQGSVSVLRNFRKLHRKVSIVLFSFLFIVALTGLLLGWKKHSGGLILPESSKGVSSDLKTWLTFDSLHIMAIDALRDSLSPHLSPELERIDARPQKGMVKFVFVDDYWEIQLDGTTGKVLLIARRRSDFIENIHDGTILDVIFKTSNGQLKLMYTSAIGLSLIILIITGFWLWYGPKRLKRLKRQVKLAK